MRISRHTSYVFHPSKPPIAVQQIQFIGVHDVTGSLQCLSPIQPKPNYLLSVVDPQILCNRWVPSEKKIITLHYISFKYCFLQIW